MSQPLRPLAVYAAHQNRTKGDYCPESEGSVKGAATNPSTIASWPDDCEEEEKENEVEGVASVTVCWHSSSLPKPSLSTAFSSNEHSKYISHIDNYMKIKKAERDMAHLMEQCCSATSKSDSLFFQTVGFSQQLSLLINKLQSTGVKPGQTQHTV